MKTKPAKIVRLSGKAIDIASKKAFFALFREEKATRDDFVSGFSFWFNAIEQKEENEGEEWKQAKTKLAFVQICDSPREIASIVRKSPQDKYFVLCGGFMPIQTHASVFIDGKNMDTLHDEWGQS